MSKLTIGTDMDIEIVVAGIVFFLCGLFSFVFWWKVLQPVKHRFQHEYEIATFRRKMSAWEHEQQCR